MIPGPGVLLQAARGFARDLIAARHLEVLKDRIAAEVDGLELDDFRDGVVEALDVQGAGLGRRAEGFCSATARPSAPKLDLRTATPATRIHRAQAMRGAGRRAVTPLGPARGCRERPRPFRRLDLCAIGEPLGGVTMAVPDRTPALAGRFEVQTWGSTRPPSASTDSGRRRPPRGRGG